jgi:uncharacterized protein YaeQ
MALKSVIFKAELSIADLDRNYYADHALTLARHPSETEERMMVRLAAFALQADQVLSFCKGLSATDEPDLWRKDLTGAIELWIEVGLPDERRIARASGRAERVRIYAYGSSVDPWWKPLAAKLERFRNLDILRLPASQTRTLAALARRTMRLQCTIQDGHLWITDGDSSVLVEAEVLFPGR